MNGPVRRRRAGCMWGLACTFSLQVPASLTSPDAYRPLVFGATAISINATLLIPPPLHSVQRRG